MSSIPQSTKNENEISDFVSKFIAEFHLGKLLFQCNAGKVKGIPVMDVFRYLLCLIFSDRSMYMQRKTGVFEAGFCKNTVYRFLNSTKTNWLRFTTLLSASIINGFMKPLTSDERKDVFIIDDSLFDRSRSAKTELLAKVFDHCSMKYVYFSQNNYSTEAGTKTGCNCHGQKEQQGKIRLSGQGAEH